MQDVFEKYTVEISTLLLIFITVSFPNFLFYCTIKKINFARKYEF